MNQEVPYLGSKISLISKAEIRYEGTLYTIDPNEATVALAKVRSFGTEDRPTDRPLPARNEVFEFIIFRGHDIKDLHVCEPPKHCHTEGGVPPDPAIVKSSQPPPGPAGAAFHGQPAGGFQGGAGGQSYQPFTQPLFYNQGQPAPGYPPPHHGQSGGSQEEISSMVEQSPEQITHPSVTAIGTRHISGSQSSTPPLSRKSPTSDQGVQVQPRSPEKSSNENQQKQVPHNHNYSHHQHHQQHHHHHHHQQQQQREYPRGQGGMRHGGGHNSGGHNSGGHRDRGDNRNDGRATDPRGERNVTSFVRGRGGNRGQQMREGGAVRGPQGHHPRHRGRGARSSEPLKFDTDFDFETSNAQFLKEDIEKELKNLNLNDKSVNGDKTEDDPEIEEEEGEGEEEDDENVYYDKKKSFFDNISCEATDKSRGQRGTWREERKLNSETFGISENYRRNYRGRSNWRGGNQRGWRGRGRGGGYGGREGGYHNREGGYNNREGGYNNREGGYNNREGGYNNREGGYNNRDGGYNNREGGYNNRDGGYSNRDGGYNNREGGYYGNRGSGRGGRRSHDWDYGDRRRMDGPQRVEVQS